MYNHLLSGPGLTMECPLWSLHVEDAGDGGGGMSGLKVELLLVSGGLLSTFSCRSLETDTAAFFSVILYETYKSRVYIEKILFYYSQHNEMQR